MAFKKHKKYSIEEKNKIVLLYMDQHMGRTQIIRTYDILSSSLNHWIIQYREYGTCKDERGRCTKLENPNKGRPRKYIEKSYEEMTKDELIERLKLYDDIKKSLACLDEAQKKNTK